jgi:hypothetical protein
MMQLAQSGHRCDLVSHAALGQCISTGGVLSPVQEMFRRRGRNGYVGEGTMQK